MEEFVELALGLLALVPAILKGGDGGVAVVALRGLEEEVVVALRVERRVEVDEIELASGKCARSRRTWRLSP